jgi:hypothetical protein
MTTFFFYNKLNNIELVKKINTMFHATDGYIIIKNYDNKNNILEISEKSIENDKILHGAIVHFDMTLDNVIRKINNLEEFRLEDKTKYNLKYKLEKILVNKKYGGVCDAYIIY